METEAAAAKFDSKGLKFSESKSTVDVVYKLGGDTNNSNNNNTTSDTNIGNGNENFQKIIYESWNNNNTEMTEMTEMTVALFKKVCVVKLGSRLITVKSKGGTGGITGNGSTGGDTKTYLSLPLPQVRA